MKLDESCFASVAYRPQLWQLNMMVAWYLVQTPGPLLGKFDHVVKIFFRRWQLIFSTE